MSVIGEEEVRGCKAVFKTISADDQDQQPTEIESLCMNCYQNDLNREVVKADSATTKIPELDFEIPAFSQKGALSTVEGLIDRAVAGLEQDQPLRKESDPEVALKIEEFIDKLKQLKDVEKPFTLIIDDPSGNSFVENPFAPHADEALSVTHYERNAQQNLQLGIKTSEEVEQEQLGNKIEDMRNEVKSGGATEKHGTRITLHVTDVTDMSRDLLKSETCRVLIPELDFELGMAALGGKFTTLEGLLKDIKDLIVEKNPFTAGDSCTKEQVEKLQAFGKNIDKILNGQMDVHIILDDSAGNSYLQNLYAPDDDPEMKTEKYERTYEQNEELGLNDMKTEGYQEENNVD
ncbi:ZPR1 protein, partial [Polypterus senegalus]